MEKKQIPRTLYEKMDDALLNSATKAVMAWNWTTGGTKASLANSLIWAGDAVLVAVLGYFSYKYDIPVPPVIGAVVCSAGCFIAVKRNNKYEKLEADAASKGAIDYEVENFKDRCKFNSQGFLGAGVVTGGMGLTLAYHLGDVSMPCACSFSDALLAGSQYVMRTEYMPPKKNAFARGWEKVKEFARDLPPVLQPVTASVALRGAFRG